MTPGTFGAAGWGNGNWTGLECEYGCYLLHFDTPVRGVQHYIGWAPNLKARIEKHFAGEGSELTKACVAAGVTMRLVRVWLAKPLEFEKTLKARREGPRMCPICKKPRVRSPRKSRGAERCPG